MTNDGQLRNLNLAAWNAGSLANKVEEIKIFLSDHDIHILLASET